MYGIFVFSKIDFYILLSKAFVLTLLSYKRYVIRFDWGKGGIKEEIVNKRA